MLREIFTYSILQFKNSICKTIKSIRLHTQYFKNLVPGAFRGTSKVLLPVQNAFKFLYKVKLATSLNIFKMLKKYPTGFSVEFFPVNRV